MVPQDVKDKANQSNVSMIDVTQFGHFKLLGKYVLSSDRAMVGKGQMSSSRETSPDWLRCFQAPTQSALSLSSASQSPPEDNPVSEGLPKETSHSSEKNNSQDTGESPVDNTLKAKSPSKSKNKKADLTRLRKRGKETKKNENIDSFPCSNIFLLGNAAGNGVDGEVSKKETSVKTTKPHETKHPVWTLSSDSESSPDSISVREHNSHHEELSAHEIGGQSPLKEASKVKSPKKQLKTEDHIPRKRQKLNSHMNKEGMKAEFTGLRFLDDSEPKYKGFR
ncbi:unnamed protein product [Ilex paraguariensis]|uniref:Uncharacterized protein n=1 Tax=Ilex paraguariensis TaxID=185542 RepID=A0ABC8SIS9_9AQUA